MARQKSGGVDAPMPVIRVGALGGMATGGIIWIFDANIPSGG